MKFITELNKTYAGGDDDIGTKRFLTAIGSHLYLYFTHSSGIANRLLV